MYRENELKAFLECNTDRKKKCPGEDLNLANHQPISMLNIFAQVYQKVKTAVNHGKNK